MYEKENRAFIVGIVCSGMDIWRDTNVGANGKYGKYCCAYCDDSMVDVYFGGCYSRNMVNREKTWISPGSNRGNCDVDPTAFV